MDIEKRKKSLNSIFTRHWSLCQKMSDNEPSIVKEFSNLYSNEPSIVKEFRNLYDYVCNMGRCINQIHDRLEKIEKNLSEISINHITFVEENTAMITNIRDSMVNKNEFNGFIEKMKVSLGEMLPPLPTLEKEMPPTEESSQETISQ